MRHRGEHFADQIVDLDGASFEGCTFLRCKPMFSGRAPVSLVDNTLVDCEFALKEAAALTMGFLKGMAASSDGFLLTLIRALQLDPARLARLSAKERVGVPA